MMTLLAGRIRTWRLPRFSALKMLRRQSFSTFMRTMAPARSALCRPTRTRADKLVVVLAAARATWTPTRGRRIHAAAVQLELDLRAAPCRRRRTPRRARSPPGHADAPNAGGCRGRAGVCVPRRDAQARRTPLRARERGAAHCGAPARKAKLDRRVGAQKLRGLQARAQAAQQQARGGSRHRSRSGRRHEWACHGVRLIAGRLRDGLHVLRDGADGVQGEPQRGRDPGAGVACRAAVQRDGRALARHERRLHGHG